jgi:hypothetical protein
MLVENSYKFWSEDPLTWKKSVQRGELENV